MYIALDSFTNERITAKPGIKAICPGCQNLVIARCGDIRIWHWAHKISICTYDSEPETEWHLAWKKRALCAGFEIEKIIDDHRADIYDSGRNMVIEVQHSPITDEDIIKRCDFYTSKGIKLAWIFDYIDRYNQDKIVLVERKSGYKTDTFYQKRGGNKAIRHLFYNNGKPKYDVYLNLEYKYDSDPLMFKVVGIFNKGLSYDGSGYGYLYYMNNLKPEVL